MLDKTGIDIFEQPAGVSYCITTNGTIKSNGHAVMGRGVAAQFNNKYGGFPAELLGAALKTRGNHLTYLGQFEERHVFSFPVKHEWFQKADIDLIRRSALELRVQVEWFVPYFKEILLPRPGCGNGQLTWEEVKPVIEPILDDRVIAVTL